VQRVRQVHDPRSRGLSAPGGAQGLCDAVIRNFKAASRRARGRRAHRLHRWRGANEGGPGRADAFELTDGQLLVPDSTPGWRRGRGRSNPTRRRKPDRDLRPRCPAAGQFPLPNRW
jgi:hypothetical protein